MIHINNIKILWKYRLAALGFFIPLTILMYLLISEKNISIDFVQKELKGAEYLTTFSNLLSKLNDIKTDTDNENISLTNVTYYLELNKYFLEINKEKSIFSVLFHNTNKLNDILKLWEKINEPSKRFAPDYHSQTRKLYIELERKISDLISFVGDASNLILDPDLQSYYLNEVCVNKIPEQISILNKISDIHKLKKTKFNNQESNNKEIYQLAGLLKSNNEAIKNSIATSLGSNNSIKANTKLKALVESNKDSINYLIQNLGYNNYSEPYGTLVSSHLTNTMASTFVLWRFSIGEMKILLEKRIQGFNNNKVITILFIFIVISFTLMFFLLLSRGIIKSVTQLDAAAEKVMNGNYNSAVEVNGFDELGNLSRRFNQMISIISENFRQHSERLEQTESALNLEIDEHKQAAAALNRSELLFGQLWNISVDGMRLVNEDGIIIALNEAYCKIIGKSKDEILGHNYLECYHISQRDIILEQFNIDLNEGYPQTHFERKTLLWDDRTLWLELSNSFLQIPNSGKLVLSIVKDITERKKDEEKLKNFTGQLRNLASRIQSIREEERTMIAREIHDELGQVLTVLKIQISLLSNKLRDDQQLLKDKIISVSKVIDATVESVQKISAKLRPGILDDLGLISALEWQAQDFQDSTGIICESNLPKDDIILDQEKSTAIFRIFQESLTNIARHAEASYINVSLKQNEYNLELIVYDNGKGITPKQIQDSKSLGLLGMKERALILGGTVNIEGVPGKGTKVKVLMPVLQNEEQTEKKI